VLCFFVNETEAIPSDLAQKNLFLLDLDGTLYLDGRLFDGAAEFLRYVKHCGGVSLYLTNNSSRGADAYVDKLRRLGIPAEPGDFLTSVDAAVRFLRARRTAREDVFYVCGTQSFKNQLRREGFALAEAPDPSVTALLCGFDTELTFQKLEDSCVLLNRGVDFIATNPDWVCPTWYGYVPDCGSVCEMLRRATGRTPKVVGKPQPEMVLLAMERTGRSPEETLVVGDRIYTDVLCGVNAGVDTALVLSGESTMDTVRESGVRPTTIYRDIAQLLEQLKKARGA
jgi:HAD superfamily hydrolase (TIGR01450 family)